MTAAKSLSGIASYKAHMAIYYFFYPGRINALMDLSSETLRIAEKSGDTMARGHSHATYGTACYAKGRMEDAVRHLSEGRDLCKRIGFYSWAGVANAYLAWTYLEMEAHDKAKVCLVEAMENWQRIHFFPSWTRWAKLATAMCGILLGEGEANLEMLRAIPKKNRLKVAEGPNCYFLGRIFLHLGGEHMPEAEQWIKRAIEANGRYGMRFFLGQDHALYGDFFKQQHHRSRARKQFGKAAEIMQECGADGWVEKYEQELSALA
jgi:tetratricopeptide (TPR) repeat protein